MYYFLNAAANFISIGKSLPEKSEQDLVLNQLRFEKDSKRMIII
jgi:hypothetical protein